VLKAEDLLEFEDPPELIDHIPDSHHNGRIQAWTDSHSWLVVVGGKAFGDTSLKICNLCVKTENDKHSTRKHSS
jgi:hypothetical protein